MKSVFDKIKYTGIGAYSIEYCTKSIMLYITADKGFVQRGGKPLKDFDKITMLIRSFRLFSANRIGKLL